MSTPSTYNIVGIDPGTKNFAFTILHVQKSQITYKYFVNGTLNNKSETQLCQAIIKITQNILEKTLQNQPTFVFIEQQFLRYKHIVMGLYMYLHTIPNTKVHVMAARSKYTILPKQKTALPYKQRKQAAVNFFKTMLKNDTTLHINHSYQKTLKLDDIADSFLIALKGALIINKNIKLNDFQSKDVLE